MLKKTLQWALIVSWGVASVAQAQQLIYKWTYAQGQVQYTEPVSYTHLDVYKRQAPPTSGADPHPR